MLLRNIKVNYFRKEKNKRKELIKEEFVGISRCQLHITASIHCGGELYRKLFTSLLQAGLVVLAKLCSIFVELTQVQCLHYCHETCRKEQVCVPSVQSQDLLVVGRLGDMTLKLKRCYRTFEFQSHVRYA